MKKRDLSWIILLSLGLLVFMVARGEPGLLVGSHGGSGVGVLFVSPSPHNFGNVQVGSTIVVIFTAYNHSSTTYSFEAITFTGANSTDWSILTSNIYTSIPAYTGTGTVGMQFSPATTGSRAGTASFPYTSTW